MTLSFRLVTLPTLAILFSIGTANSQSAQPEWWTEGFKPALIRKAKDKNPKVVVIVAQEKRMAIKALAYPFYKEINALDPSSRGSSREGCGGAGRSLDNTPPKTSRVDGDAKIDGGFPINRPISFSDSLIISNK